MSVPSDNEPLEEHKPPFWSVAIYLEDRYYGGPEEGGWYYTAGERVDEPVEPLTVGQIMPYFGFNYDDACAEAHEVQCILDATVNLGRRDLSSVLSQGKYYAEVHQGYPPKHFPEETPHYE